MGKMPKRYNLDKIWARRQLIRKNGAICAICTKPFGSMKEITLDHIIPVSKGGLDVIENYQLACDGCNQAKRDMMPEEFAAMQGNLTHA